MDNPRAEKVAVVDEVRERLGAASASVVTEYRGLSVGELAQLRQALAAAGGDYKIFKNTLVRLAIADGEHRLLEPLLTGPTGIAFVHGEVSAVAKALRDFSRANAHLVVKGGLLEGNLLSSNELAALADLPSREVLLARLAGAIAAPMRQLGALMEALPRNLAYGLSALVDSRGAEAPAATAAPAPEAEAPAVEAPAPAAEAPAAASESEGSPQGAAEMGAEGEAAGEAGAEGTPAEA